jgi:capsule polysaccharide export protein KpsE/RkpR
MFAEKLLELSQASLERARLESEKQQLYLVTVVRPTQPEENKYPRPIVGTLLIFALCLVIWSMISLVVASIRDHMGG